MTLSIYQVPYPALHKIPRFLNLDYPNHVLYQTTISFKMQLNPKPNNVEYGFSALVFLKTRIAKMNGDPDLISS